MSYRQIWAPLEHFWTIFGRWFFIFPTGEKSFGWLWNFQGSCQIFISYLFYFKSLVAPISHEDSKNRHEAAFGSWLNIQLLAFLGSLEASLQKVILGYVDQSYSGLCRPPILKHLWAGYEADKAMDGLHGLSEHGWRASDPQVCLLIVLRAKWDAQIILRYVDRLILGYVDHPQKCSNYGPFHRLGT